MEQEEITKEKIDKIQQEIEQERKWEEERIKIGEERTGVEGGFIDRCNKLYDYFDMYKFEETNDLPLTDIVHGPTEIQENFIFDSLARFFVGDYEPPFEKDYKDLECINNQKWEDINHEISRTPPKIAFAIGYILGQMFDITDPDIQADIEPIKKVIKEKQLLPYVPRERRAP